MIMMIIMSLVIFLKVKNNCDNNSDTINGDSEKDETRGKEGECDSNTFDNNDDFGDFQ